MTKIIFIGLTVLIVYLYYKNQMSQPQVAPQATKGTNVNFDCERILNLNRELAERDRQKTILQREIKDLEKQLKESRELVSFWIS
jgi:hypothetical protein